MITVTVLFIVFCVLAFVGITVLGIMLFGGVAGVIALCLLPIIIPILILVGKNVA